MIKDQCRPQQTHVRRCPVSFIRSSLSSEFHDDDCNSPIHPLTILSTLGLLRTYLKCVTRERSPHSYKVCFVPLFNRCKISQFTLLGIQHPLWHIDPDIGFDTNCNTLIHLLAILSALYSSCIDLKCFTRERSSHSYKACLISFSNQCEISQWFSKTYESVRVGVAINLHGDQSLFAHHKMSAEISVCETWQWGNQVVFIFWPTWLELWFHIQPKESN